jgi:hypothetical protein
VSTVKIIIEPKKLLHLFMWLFFLFLAFTSPVSAAEYNASSSVSVSASIGQNRVTINGYTSPDSRVELSSPRVFAVTYSDSTGYFAFDKTLLPRNPSDLCLISIDQDSRHTTPICIPPPPINNYQTDIGPILLPPTLSLENDKINPNATVITSGQSIPNSQISLHFYKVTDNAISFPKEVQAYSLPSLTFTTDKDGHFSLNLPTAYSSNYRLFASTKLYDNYSPKSNTLIYILPSLLYIFMQQNRFLIFLLPLFIFTIIIFVYLLHLYFRPSPIRFLPAIKKYYPAVSNPNPTLSLDKARD